MVGDREEQDIVAENDAVRAVFTNRGAVLKSWTLKRYKDGKGALARSRAADRPRRSPAVYAPGGGRQALGNAAGTRSTTPSNPALTVGSTPASLSFEYRDASGLAVRKDFGFDPAHPYVVDFTAAVSQNGAP